MSYDLPVWVNGVAPGISDTNLNKLTDALADLDTRTGLLEAGVAVSAQTAAYTLVLGDASKAVEVDSSSGCNLTVPPNSAVAFPVGALVEIVQVGTGQIILLAGAGVTLRSSNGLKLRTRYSVASLRKRATNDWLVSGDVVA